MREIKAPEKYEIDHRHESSLFLAGSIEMGAAVDWQEEVAYAMRGHGGVLLNPRRNDWDASWEQSIDNPQFKEQVTWELQAMADADVVAMYFAPGTKSPITLLEYGLWARSPKLVVCCPGGFWRKGNVDVVAERYDVKQVPTLEALIKSLTGRYWSE